MTGTLNGQPQMKTQNFSVETVRNLLKTDNKGIAKLCAQVSLMPKKDKQGRTYFTKDDIEILRRIKDRNEQSKTLNRSRKAYATVPVKSVSPVTPVKDYAAKTLNVPSVGVKTSTGAAVEKICTSLSAMENNLTDKISSLIDKKLDEKLDGMDEVVVELVRCKTENETLRYKMNELNKEVYNLKNELSKYKSVGLGLYVKKNSDPLI